MTSFHLVPLLRCFLEEHDLVTKNSWQFLVFGLQSFDRSFIRISGVFE